MLCQTKTGEEKTKQKNNQAKTEYLKKNKKIGREIRSLSFPVLYFQWKKEKKEKEKEFTQRA